MNAGKRLGVGFNFDYIYGRGYYQNQSTSHFNYTMYGSYLGDRYQAHILFSTNHQKVTENGGITDDNFVLHPESFDDALPQTRFRPFWRTTGTATTTSMSFSHTVTMWASSAR